MGEREGGGCYSLCAIQEEVYLILGFWGADNNCDRCLLLVKYTILERREVFELKVNDDTRTQLGRGFYGRRVIVFTLEFVKIILQNIFSNLGSSGLRPLLKVGAGTNSGLKYYKFKF